MDTEKLAVMCRCGHARRFHQQGTIWQGYDTRCCVNTRHSGDYFETGCLFFESADVRLVILRRGSDGRFRPMPT